MDQLRIYAKGGAGGQGFERIGGVGGKGGNVIARAKTSVTLEQIKGKYPQKRFIAENGRDSRKLVILGSSGEDMILEVPVGVVIENERGAAIGDLNEEDQEILLARGGQGGNPDNHFIGQKGEGNVISLNLKLIADIGLVGFPNAGKSTLLSAVSRSRPKIANYPFTTIQPQIGTMFYEDLRQITMADLPGLIEGAHINIGMGHKFLKHLERTKLLLMVVDINGFQLSHNYQPRSAVETVALLNKELELYKRELLDKPAVLVLNKIDGDNDGSQTAEILDRVNGLHETVNEMDEELVPQKLMKFDDIIAVSAKNKINIDKLKDRLRDLLDVYASTDNTNTGTDVALTDSSDIYSRSDWKKFSERRDTKLV
ncbi:hypothetical protein FSP39_000006 [Pinctada imbricata]|uniref:GTP-binding protein 10 n=1 Tax=Pinctada imbricata TaxID=66713 RepID=A0AA89CBB2_PINIB|nr:hypothetical protein FSP39_000006 [Pinctada imbricata]